MSRKGSAIPKVNEDKCIGCSLCVPWCPVEAIAVREDKKAEIDSNKCVECWICYRVFHCPVEAIEIPAKLEWPRNLVWSFACPTKDWSITRVAGRGTEEMKTNDVTDRIKSGETGFGVELGQPGIATTFKDVEQITTAVAPWRVIFEEENPVTTLIDVRTGKLKNRELNSVRVLSIVLEFRTVLERTGPVLEALRDASKRINTVMSVGVINRVEPDGSIPVLQILEKLNIKNRPNMKVNVGLGKVKK